MAANGIGAAMRIWWVVTAILAAVVFSDGQRAAAQILCVGDCGQNGDVRVNELIIGVNIALERAALSTCPSFDPNNSDSVEVNELVQGVNNALNGCPSTPTATNTTGPTNTPPSPPTATATASATLTVTAGTVTPTVDEATPTPTLIVTVGTATPTGTVDEATATPTVIVTVGTATPTGTADESTPTPTVSVGTATPTGTVIEEATPTPTATATPGDGSPTVIPIARLGGATTIVVNALGTIPTLIGAIANGIDFGGASGFDVGYRGEGGFGAAACPGGGTATRTGNLFPGFNLNITLSACRIATADGFVTFNGRIVQSGTTITVDNGNTTTPGPLTAQYEDDMGMPTVLAEAQVVLTVSGIPSLGGACDVTAVTFSTNGTVRTTLESGPSAEITFTGTTITINMITFSPSCVPVQYRLTLNGNASLFSSANDTPSAVSFNTLLIDVNDTGDPATFSISGGMTSSCFGGTATIATIIALQLPDNDVCPSAGLIAATVSGNTTRVIYNTNDSVDLDYDNNGSVDESFPHCQDPRLYECLA